MTVFRNSLEAEFQTAFIDQKVNSTETLRPAFISNDRAEGKKVLSSVEEELLRCDQFAISVAFVTMSGLTPLLQTLKELEKRGIPGKVLTTNYLSFSEPRALEKLHELKNIQVRLFDADAADCGFHTKGYIFRKEEIYRIIIGSSNITGRALTENREWNLKVISTEEGEIAQKVLEEFQSFWNSRYSLAYDDFIESYKVRYEISKKQKELAKQQQPVSLQRYRLQPNSMQSGFIASLKKIVASGEDRALLISATGTGKTYASAFAVREFGFRKVLFLVHRGELAKQIKKAYENVFGNTRSMGLVGGGWDEYDKDFVFATIQTLNRDSHLFQYSRDHWDCIVLDEAHHSSADSYQKVMRYFTPRFWLGMTATPDRMDDYLDGRNIYQIFHYQIAYEIRLQQAMEENLLCPFHYFGISDLAMIDDGPQKSKKLTSEDFNRLTSDERVRHIISQAQYYGYSGERVKGLIFCSRIEESIELSRKFNQAGYRTIALNGDADSTERMLAFERLAMREEDATEDLQPLDYVFSVDILNEGVDIVEVNQVIMLRPTQSPIVFIQQLGRGLRKADGKEYVVILDFIGNYEKNFMIPVALSGDRSYNPDTIRRYVIGGNRTIPGASTVHFDEIARERIFHSIDRIRGMKQIIRDSYQHLKDRLGRVPYLMDFYQNEEIDPLVIIREFRTYYSFLMSVEKEIYKGLLDDQEILTLEYLSKTILSGVRPYELEILRKFLVKDSVSEYEVKQDIENMTRAPYHHASFLDAIGVLEGRFVAKDDEYQKFCHIDIINQRQNKEGMIYRLESYAGRLQHQEFRREVNDLIEVGFRRYHDIYAKNESGSPFVLYEKYSRRDVSLLMNCGKDLSSIMYGMKRIGDDVFIFITYHKQEAEDETKQYAEGKPDYADAFADDTTFRWDSQIGKGPDSSYMQLVKTAVRKHLLVKKSDAETSFYYMGTFDILSAEGAEKMDNNGKMKPITKVTMRMHHPVRADLLQYFESSMLIEETA